MEVSNANFKRNFETNIPNASIKCKLQMQTSNANLNCKLSMHFLPNIQRGTTGQMQILKRKKLKQFLKNNFQKQIGKVIRLGEPRETGGNLKRVLQKGCNWNLGEPTGAGTKAQPLYTE